MIEIYDDPDLYEEANDTLIGSYIDLMEGNFNYIDNIDIVEELIHTIRTYDNKRRRKQIDAAIQELRRRNTNEY